MAGSNTVIRRVLVVALIPRNKHFPKGPADGRKKSCTSSRGGGRGGRRGGRERRRRRRKTKKKRTRRPGCGWMKGRGCPPLPTRVMVVSFPHGRIGCRCGVRRCHRTTRQESYWRRRGRLDGARSPAFLYRHPKGIHRSPSRAFSHAARHPHGRR